MVSEWRYRGRVVTTDDVTSIRQLIAENPGASRRRLSEKLCEVWQWKQANGALRDMVCRGLLLMLQRQEAGAMIHPHPKQPRGGRGDTALCQIPMLGVNPLQGKPQTGDSAG